MADFLKKVEAWLADDNNTSNLKGFVENFYAALVNFLSFIGEWPIDFD